MFNSPTIGRAGVIVSRENKYIEKIASVIKEKGTFEDKRVTLGDILLSGPANFLFYLFIVKTSSFRTTAHLETLRCRTNV